MVMIANQSIKNLPWLAPKESRLSSTREDLGEL